MNRYYLVAGLPWLVLGEPPDISAAEFEERCRNHLPAADAEEAARLLRGDAAGLRSAFARAWSRRDAQLRNQAARLRAARRGVDVQTFLREQEGWDGWIVKGVEDAFALASPLDREVALDRMRWGFADDLARPEPFGLAAVLAYAVKLRLALRWAGLPDGAPGERLAQALDRVAAIEATS